MRFFVWWGYIREENANKNSISEERIEQLREENEEKYSKNKEEIHYHGRKVIYSSLRENELTPENIKRVLPDLFAIHLQNVNEIDYLDNYYKGMQPIWKKTKVVRPDINNTVLVNHAYEIVEFKKSYVFGDPVQYVQKGENDLDEVNPNISKLNRYMESEDKSSKDKELAEWMYKIGTGYRWIEADSKIDDEDEDEAPFEISIPNPRNTFVVYSTGIKKKQLFSCYYESFNLLTDTNDSNKISSYKEITVYTYDKVMVFTDIGGNLQLKKLGDKIPNPYKLEIKGHRIIEYPLNSSRIGLIELVMSQLNALNRITSNELDDIEQFVQSLLVYINQDVDAELHKKLIKLGAVKVNTSEPSKPADVKLLSQKIAHSETKVLKDELYNNALTIVGMPRLNDKPSGGDTGQARLLGEGWTMADERAKQDELSFKEPERQFLKLAIKICSEFGEELQELKISDIDIKFTRNKSDNILVKTQALMNLKSAEVPPDIAFSVIGLFNDPNEVFQKAKKFYGDKLWKEEIKKLTDTDKSKQDLKVTDSVNLPYETT